MRSDGLEAFVALDRAARGRGLRVLLVGAAARHLVFDRLHREDPYRATRDVDAVVRVPDWYTFRALVAELVARNGFTATGDHHMRYLDGTELDLLPFGGVADDRGNLTWEMGDREMSLDGLDTANANSELVDVHGVSIRVASLPSLVALKLFAFRDRAHREPKDLDDLVYILMNASDTLLKRIYDELGSELADLEFDETGPFLLGQDVAGIAPKREVTALLEILDARVLVPPHYVALSRLRPESRRELAIRQFAAFRRGLADH